MLSEPAKIEQVQDDTEQRSKRRSKTDGSKAGIRSCAHGIGKWNTDDKGLKESLDHCPDRALIAIEVAKQREQDSCYDRFRNKPSQISSTCLNVFRIARQFPRPVKGRGL